MCDSKVQSPGKKVLAGGGDWGGRQRGQDFLPIVFNHNFTYEMVEPQGKIAMDGNFRKRRTGCPLLPTHPHGYNHTPFH